ncbi:MAG: fatty acid desaturase [Deltaproteobacteria bacterium]|nr:fatty acid desaturase [Deltaproteobacteria bacterium]
MAAVVPAWARPGAPELARLRPRALRAAPALVYPVSPWAAFSLAVNLVLGELYANLHSFVVIVSNHAGGDLYRFDLPARSKAEFQLRQILASVNFRTGGDLNDFLHGFLNYQIEHHLWPSWSPRQYQRAQPRVKEICARHGVPYVQQPVWQRLRRLVGVIVGTEEPTLVDTREPDDVLTPAA